MGDLGAPVMVAKNTLVTLLLEAPGIALSAQGRALDDAARGGVVPVMNLASRQVVEGRRGRPGPGADRACRWRPPLKPVLICAVLALAGCGTFEKLSRVGRSPELAPVASPTADPKWRPHRDADPHRLGAADACQQPVASRQPHLPARPARGAGRRPDHRAGLDLGLGDAAEPHPAHPRRHRHARHPAVVRHGDAYLPEPRHAGDAGADQRQPDLGWRRSVKRTESVTLRLAATVTQVLPNGNLAVSGRQQVRVNEELRDLTVAGVVRRPTSPLDNTIKHDRLAEARIAYGGKGTLSDLQHRGLGSRSWTRLLPF